MIATRDVPACPATSSERLWAMMLAFFIWSKFVSPMLMKILSSGL